MVRHGDCRTWRLVSNSFLFVHFCYLLTSRLFLSAASHDHRGDRYVSLFVFGGIPSGAFINWMDWDAVDELLGQTMNEGFVDTADWMNKLHIGRGASAAEKYDWSRYVLGECLQYQEGEEDLDTNPRFRLADLKVSLQELVQGQRVLCPHYSHSDVMKYMKVLWTLLKPEPQSADGGVLFVFCDHEGCSSSFCIDGFCIDVIWDLHPEIHAEIIAMYKGAYDEHRYDLRKEFISDLSRHFFLNRGDIVVCEDGSVYGKQMEFWTENALSPETAPYLFTPTEENRASWQTDHIMHVHSGVAGDVTGLLERASRQPSDYINTILYPEQTSDGFIADSERNAFKSVNKCALAKHLRGPEYEFGSNNCTI